MLFTALIIDDEQNNIDNLKLLLNQYCPNISIINHAKNAFEAEKIINLKKPEIIFLDIQMPEKNGFQLLQSLPNHNFEIIFVTAFDQYGIKAIKFSAIDYLLKPIDIEELKAAVQKAIVRIQEKKQNQHLDNLIQILQNKQEKEHHRIGLSTSKETRFVKTGEIIRCEASNNYTTFYLEEGEKIITSRPISEYEGLLNTYGFIRCHQSHLLNKKFIKSISKQDGGYLILFDNSTIPISRTKKELVKNAMTNS